MSVSTTHRRPRQDSSMSTCRASCADRFGRNPKLHGRKSASKTGSSTIFTRRLHDPVADRRDRQRPLLARARLRDEHPPRRQRPPPLLPQLRGQLAEQPGHPVLLDVRQGESVDARQRRCCGAPPPTPAQDVPAVDLVAQRMEPSVRIGLGRPVKRMLQRADPVPTDSRQGGPSRNSGTHRSGPSSVRVNEAAALPSPQVVLSCGSTGTTAASDSLPAPRPLPGSTPVIGRRLPRQPAARFGRGGPPQFPPPPSERSAPSYAGESLAAALPGSSPLPWPSP